MIEDDPSSEPLASPDQAQAVVDQVARITAELKALSLPGQGSGQKLRWSGNTCYTYYPDGKAMPGDPDVLVIASVSQRNEDGSLTAYESALGLNGMQLAKHIYPPLPPGARLRPADVREAKETGDYTKVFASTVTLAAGAAEIHAARVTERALGLHSASFTEAAELVTTLEQAPVLPA